MLSDYKNRLKQQRLHNKKISRINIKFNDNYIEWIKVKSALYQDHILH